MPYCADDVLESIAKWMIIIDGEWNRMHESQPPTVQAQYSANPNVGLDWDIQPRINAILFVNIVMVTSHITCHFVD